MVLFESMNRISYPICDSYIHFIYPDIADNFNQMCNVTLCL